jgi:prepilin-type N-terminal cleavage/methylation domain-containing protein
VRSCPCNYGARRRRGGGFSCVRRGFTIIELIAVLLVVAIVAATAAPTLSGLADTRAAMAAKHLLRDMAFARQRAVATGVPVWIVFDLTDQEWEILEEDPNTPGRAGATPMVDPVTGRIYTIEMEVDDFAGISLVSVTIDGNVEIGFDWLGRPLNSADTDLAAVGTVTLTGNHRVTIEPTTGLAQYLEP